MVSTDDKGRAGKWRAYSKGDFVGIAVAREASDAAAKASEDSMVKRRKRDWL
jgi:hypothetical protein